MEINGCCGDINGARVIKLSFYIWYEVYLFYNSSSAVVNSLQPSASPPPSSQAPSFYFSFYKIRRCLKAMMVIWSCGVILFVLMVGFAFLPIKAKAARVFVV
ncbi:hypothetical protein K1719_000668 [Acacia pycnantha]|nr:hypothetical protein K1719_000668 [Acacia pycnantha]